MFKMRRGTDESSVESLGEAADPYIVNQSYGSNNELQLDSSSNK